MTEDEAIAQAVAAAPPLTEQQRETIRSLLSQDTEAQVKYLMTEHAGLMERLADS